MGHPLRYYVETAGFEFAVREVAGREHLSQLWKLELRFVLEPLRGLAAAFDPDRLMKEQAVVTMRRDSIAGPPTVERHITGIVTFASLSATASGVPEVELTLEPKLSLLTHRQDVRIHRNLTVPEIVTEVCEALGVKIDSRLTGTYPSRPYCVQWRERDFDYVMRLLEDEGVFYYFTPDDVMVLGDHKSAYDVIGGTSLLSHRWLAGMDQNDDAIIDFGRRAALQPGMVTLRDWNVDHPQLDMDVSHDTADTQGPEWYDYPGEYTEPTEGARKAALVAEAFSRKAAAARGRTTVARMYPGATFTMDDEIATDDGRYVVRCFEHAYDVDEEGFIARFEADDADVTYRPPRETFVPRILNPHTGIVTVSSPGEDIHCDELGHVKVHFHWDRLRPYDDDCSDWIPVLQDNTGGSSGIPRESWEVMVHYLEGDPDRPVVLGRVYNGEDPFAVQLPVMKTQSALRSLTSPTRIGANEIRFEDKGGFEQIYAHAEKDQLVEIANDRTAHIGHSDVESVKNDEQVNITGNATWKIGSIFTNKVGGNQTWQVGGNREWELTGSNKGTVTGNRNVEITGNVKVQLIDGALITSDEMVEKFTAALTEECTLTHESNITNKCTMDIAGSVLETIKKAKIDGANLERSETITGNKDQIAEGEHQIRIGKKRTTTIGRQYATTAAEELTLTGAKKFESMSPTSSYNATTQVTFKVGETVVTMKDGLVKIDAAQKISMVVAGASTQGAALSVQN